ncbi:MAG: bifunctional 2-polyprenyl-6-hydroxyphenol methylase/3-demethylubiquinol 3-O-methyltransferase UbiG [Methylococcales bacterium]|nr:bifunctional 2-polyprenyl-6-hydroxyphenol methylase/3-demethylubiquinol 3-O-methyltransferase UbiG [Methylococcales bacterium]MBT7409609.1 bifunctional 2-polyprenyl-6-hydroxyphenol methylase/3-demethylubiquinol 3-O-methyltransferase UbiG [Methylococcales bacterium]
MNAETVLNIDPHEVSKFEELASRWWDPNSEFKPLHDINPLRLHYIESRANISGKKVLDVGCGGGILSEGMAKNGAKVTGIDAGAAPISVAKLHLLESNVEVDYSQITIEEYCQQHEAEFDVITCLEMLEHVPDPASVIQSCKKLLKPGGDLFLSTINRNAKSYLFAIVGAEYLLKMLPKGTHDYEKFIRPSELAFWVREAGFVVSDISGMTYNPLTKLYKIDNNVDVNYLMHCQN